MATDATVTNEPKTVGELRAGGTMSNLRYSGFDQQNNTRSYVFQHMVPGEKAKPIVVSADIPMLLQHKVRIQDGPALCLYTLMLAINDVDFSQTGTLRRLVTVEDVVAYLASLPRPSEPKGKREKRPDA
ncbi:MAG: hypothetical protein DMG57_32620 [Acidobacteria bacterium]|nr:MAG: hypothetical protein DMG57_32620 [Acidobacteriota bacterium]